MAHKTHPTSRLSAAQCNASKGIKSDEEWRGRKAGVFKQDAATRAHTLQRVQRHRAAKKAATAPSFAPLPETADADSLAEWSRENLVIPPWGIRWPDSLLSFLPTAWTSCAMP